MWILSRSIRGVRYGVLIWSLGALVSACDDDTNSSPQIDCRMADQSCAEGVICNGC